MWRVAPKILFTCSILLFVCPRGQIKQWRGVAPVRRSICLFVAGKINCRSNRLQRYKHSRKAHKSRWPSHVPCLPCMGIKVINTKIGPLAVAPWQEKDPRQLKMKHHARRVTEALSFKTRCSSRCLTKEWLMVKPCLIISTFILTVVVFFLSAFSS